MEDTIEVCSGCGKMPRAIDRMKGYFLCTRCGCRTTIEVTSEDYERVVAELDQQFHQKMMKAKVAEVAKEPIEPPSRNPKRKARKPATKKKVKKTKKKAKKRKR